MQLYIDTNIYLEYFRKNSAERLTPLQELVKLIEADKVELLLPQQTKEEYYRHRKKIAEETRRALLEQSRHSSIIPAIFDKTVREIEAVKKYNKSLSDAYKKLIKKYDKDVEKEKTDADILLNKLFKLATPIKETDLIITQAYKRYMKGNPPRKNDHSYGDAITWESLIKETGKDNLVIVTKDSDYVETTQGKEVLNSFLASEWKNIAKRGKRIVWYASLAEFVNTLSPKKDKIKEEVIQEEKLDAQPAGIFAVTRDTRAGGSVFESFNKPITLVNSSSPTMVGWGGTTSVIGGFGGSVQTIYCPYCRSEIRENFFVYMNRHECSSCGKTFKLASTGF